MAYAEAAGARLYYEVHGEGEPLLLHPGYGCTVEIYWANLPELARHFRVIVFDPRGAGRSGAGDGAATPKTYADDAAAVLDAEGIDAAHVLGTSFGGMMAQHIALEHPRRRAAARTRLHDRRHAAARCCLRRRTWRSSSRRATSPIRSRPSAPPTR